MSEQALQLPRNHKLSDGSEVTLRLRLLSRLDREKFLHFTQGLPEHDLLFLRIDITDPDVVDVWLDNVDLERIITVISATGRSAATAVSTWRTRAGPSTSASCEC
jgi:hypothetical protein